MSSKAQIGHLALQEALSHERSCFRDLIDRKYMGNNEYRVLRESHPDIYEAGIGRWEKASAFADRMMAAYLKQVEDGE